MVWHSFRFSCMILSALFYPMNAYIKSIIRIIGIIQLYQCTLCLCHKLRNACMMMTSKRQSIATCKQRTNEILKCSCGSLIFIRRGVFCVPSAWLTIDSNYVYFGDVHFAQNLITMNSNIMWK